MTKKDLLPFFSAIAMLACAGGALCQSPADTMAFTVSMDQPNSHYYHVKLRCEGPKGDAQDFKMPVWMPGIQTGIL